MFRWIYTLFLMLDANFRAKCKARGLDDYELGSGWSYFVEEKKYQDHLKKHGAQKEVRTDPPGRARRDLTVYHVGQSVFS